MPSTSSNGRTRLRRAVTSGSRSNAKVRHCFTTKELGHDCCAMIGSIKSVRDDLSRATNALCAWLCSRRRKGVGRTSPNPAVGAMSGGERKGGRARPSSRRGRSRTRRSSACDRRRSRSPKTAVLYVTLEPCSTSGTDAALHASDHRCGSSERGHRRDRRQSPSFRSGDRDCCGRLASSVRTGVLAQECRL